MVNGRVAKFLKEITLVGQPFVKDPDMTVGKLLGNAGAKVVAVTSTKPAEELQAAHLVVDTLSELGPELLRELIDQR